MNDVVDDLRSFADAIDRDRGYATGATETMRHAADEILHIRKMIDRAQQMLDELPTLIEHSLYIGTKEQMEDDLRYINRQIDSLPAVYGYGPAWAKIAAGEEIAPTYEVAPAYRKLWEPNET